jgi:hypothetical protein
MPQGSVLGPLFFLAYVNDIWRNTESNIRLFADDCIIYRKRNDSSDIDKLQKDLNKLVEWALENTVEPLITGTAGEFKFCPYRRCTLVGVRQVTYPVRLKGQPWLTSTSLAFRAAVLSLSLSQITLDN